jgi:hypothetical protein
MRRFLYIAGWSYVLIAATLIWMRPLPTRGHLGASSANGPPSAPPGTSAASWFAQVKPYCNPLEVEVRLQSIPVPAGWDGAGYAAACWAVAGKIDRARQIVMALAEAERGNASSIVFDVGHPIADAGDDLSAGPIMGLVVEFQPWNYMALYHAGIAYYATGRFDLAQRHLTEFLRLYSPEDGWRSNALTVLGRLGAETGPDAEAPSGAEVAR